MPESAHALDGRVAVVTGSARGIGRATAEALVAAGASVIVTSRDGDVAQRAAKEIGAVEGLALDVTDPGQVGSVFRTIASGHGRIDALVANAGVLENAPIGMIRPDLVARMLDTNVAGTISTVQAAARMMMRKKGGSIVLLASILGERGSAGQTAYAASKAAVAAIAKSAAKELGPRGIRVNAVAPGLIETDLIRDLPAEVIEQRVADTALRRLGRPEDVARVIRFLLCDDAAFVTGQVIGIDGGLVL
ncbi:SDR family NAD(P)-dependent oxidoreductase [Micromonospora haikouensis]|uniref:SDR family NAD(P)-dependent oxidoreductase n=1 Tax=Micromonospora haikouensis TaxID=686309 RepID=UPI003D919842